MLRGWPIALVAATGASALFAFGVVQSAFAPQAQALFIVFAAVLFLLALGNRVLRGGGGHGGGNGHAAHGHGGDHAVVMSGKLIGTITVLAALAGIVFFWTDNELSGEKIGRYLDQSAVGLGEKAQLTFARFTDGRANEAPPPEQDQPAGG